MVCAFSPVLHTLPVTELDVNKTDPPWQNVTGPEVEIVTVGIASTITVTEREFATHPLVPVTVTT